MIYTHVHTLFCKQQSTRRDTYQPTRSMTFQCFGRPPKVIEEEIGRFFADRAFGLATMVAWMRIVVQCLENHQKRCSECNPKTD